MLSKVLAVVQSKAALAVLGVVLVGGGGTAAAYAATGHQLPLMGTQAQATEKPDATHAAGDNHAHTVSIEGTLKAVNGNTITVASATESSDAPKATEKPEATETAKSTEAPEATEKPEATQTAKSTEAPEATKTPTTYTITVNDKTRINGANASALADLAKNIGHKVEVQAEKQSDGSLVAWKVTVQGADSDGSHDGNGGTSTSHVPTVTVQVNGLQGTIKSVSMSNGTGSVVIQLADGSTKTVVINSKTQFKGTYNGSGSLKAGVKVNIQATTQADGTLVAVSIEVEA